MEPEAGTEVDTTPDRSMTEAEKAERLAPTPPGMSPEMRMTLGGQALQTVFEKYGMRIEPITEPYSCGDGSTLVRAAYRIVLVT